MMVVVGGCASRSDGGIPPDDGVGAIANLQ